MEGRKRRGGEGREGVSPARNRGYGPGGSVTVRCTSLSLPDVVPRGGHSFSLVLG